MKILAIDPSSVTLGWAILDSEEESLLFGTFDGRKIDYDKRYMFICEGLFRLSQLHEYSEIAIEIPFHDPSKNTAALKVAEMSIRKWAEQRKIPYFKYTSPEWKVSFVGSGKATKEDVQNIVWLEYGPNGTGQIKELPNEHECDAIGIGVHHVQIRRLEGMSVKSPEAPK